jgi:hypothetical protein
MIQGELQQTDYVRAQFLHMRPRRSFAAIGVLLLLLFAVAAFLGDGTLPLVALLAFLGALFFVYIPWRARRAFRQYKALSEPIKVTIQDEGLHFEREHGSGLLPWAQIRKWKGSNQLILLYPADHIFHLLPRHFFMNEPEFSGFQATLEARVGRSAA